MNKNLILILLCAFGLSNAELPKNNWVLLKADYTGNPHYMYSLKYTSQGNLRQGSNNTAKSTKINVVLTTTRESTPKLQLKIDSCTTKSNTYTEDLLKEIREKLLKADYALSLSNGFPSPDTSVDIPASNYLEWDLYRQLAKLLPILPEKSVPPGFAWERTQNVPMQTAGGKVSCEVYRTYKFDKRCGDSAFVSWQFRYANNSKTKDSVKSVNEIPVYGTGNGSAVIDLKKGCILTALVNFTTPVAVIGDVTVTWHENAMIELIKDVK